MEVDRGRGLGERRGEEERRGSSVGRMERERELELVWGHLWGELFLAVPRTMESPRNP